MDVVGYFGFVKFWLEVREVEGVDFVLGELLEGKVYRESCYDFVVVLIFFSIILLGLSLWWGRVIVN